MSRISDVFEPGYKALIAYITAGYPTPKATVKTAKVLAECGCDIIELGIPFSDPLADGATIQKSSFQALKRGITPEKCLEMASEIRQSIDTPLAFMTYYNPVLNFGLKEFCKRCVKAGINGLIVPDLPPDEGLELETITRKHNIDLIYLLAPTSSESRINVVASSSRGFIYLVSLTGVTGARNELSPELADFVKKVRELTDSPLCVGFGIAQVEHTKQAAALADGVIIGSKLIQLIDEDSTLASLKYFISNTREALDLLRNTGGY